MSLYRPVCNPHAAEPPSAPQPNIDLAVIIPGPFWPIEKLFAHTVFEDRLDYINRSKFNDFKLTDKFFKGPSDQTSLWNLAAAIFSVVLF